MMEMNKKEISEAQEALICNYLNWKRVKGSGSRHTFPGDVESYMWLGECKTHIHSVGKLIFEKHVWNKIQQEALSKFKYPVLFVDEGGCITIDSVWCMLPRTIEFLNVPVIKLDKIYNQSVRITTSELEDICVQQDVDKSCVLFEVNFSSELVYICSLLFFQQRFGVIC